MAFTCPACKSDLVQHHAWVGQCLSCGAHFRDGEVIKDIDSDTPDGDIAPVDPQYAPKKGKKS